MKTTRFPEIQKIVEKDTGNSSSRIPHTIHDIAIQSLLRRWKCDTEAAFLTILGSSKEAYIDLIHSVTVNETYFYREAEAYKLLLDSIIPRMLSKQTEITILSAGCSNGAEIYTAVMLLSQQYPASMQRFLFVGVDIDQRSLDQAQAGIFTRHQLREIPQALRTRYFTQLTDQRYLLDIQIREKVSFRKVNLLQAKDIATLPLCSIIFYRNVAIYFSEEVGKETLSLLSNKLSSDGVLFTSSTEIFPSNATGLLKIHAENGAYYFSKQGFETACKSSAILDRAALLKIQDQNSARNLKLNLTPTPAVSQLSNRDTRPIVTMEQIMGMAVEGNLATARRLLDLFETEQGVSSAISAIRAGIYLEENRIIEAAALCRSILHKNPDCVEPYVLLSMIERSGRKFDAALANLRSATYIDRYCWIAHYYSAEIMREQGNLNDARKRYAQTLESLQENRKYILIHLHNGYIRKEISRLCALHLGQTCIDKE